MIVLDTDHATVFGFTEHSCYQVLTTRMEASDDQAFAVTVISLEEQARGWLAEINRCKDVHEQIHPYERLRKLMRFYSTLDVLPFEEAAADVFAELRKQKVRIGTQDLKIASIALANDALLLSANLRDFHKVPGLRVENWLEETAS